MPYLSIVIPAYNEEKKISKDIEEVYKYFSENSVDGELIIVDDGSKDETFKTASEYLKKYLFLKIFTYKKNKGKGYAIKTGVLKAQGQYILIADSGMCVPYNYTNTGIELLKKGADIAFGSRKIKDRQDTILIKQPLYRRLGSKLFKFLIQTFNIIPKGIEDTQCGFKLFKKDVGYKLFGELITEKFMWDIEILRRANKVRYKVEHFPVTWSNDPDTRYRPFIGSFENLFQIITIMFRT